MAQKDKDVVFNVDSFSARLLSKRVVMKRISMREAANQIGISAATLCRLENKYIPDVYTYYACCKWLGMEMHDFFTKTPKK